MDNYYQNSYQGGSRSARKKETPVNKVEFTGYAKPRGNYQEIKLTQFSSGAKIQFTLECVEDTGSADENGNPKMRRTFVPVSVWTNKNITPTMLSGIMPGMKLHVVGRWSNQHFKGKDGQERNFTECEAYVLEVLEMPQQSYQGTMPQAPQYPQQGAMPGYGQGAYSPQGAQYLQQPMGAPQPGWGQAQPMTGQYPAQPAQPQYQQYPQYNQRPQPPQYAPAQAQPAQQQGAPVPPYYQPPQQGMQHTAAPATSVPGDIDDLPDAIAQ